MAMETLAKTFTLLMVDDNPDDYYLVKDILEETALSCDVRLVSNGKELLDYLYQMGAYAKPAQAPPPELILLYMNTPGNDGCKAIATIKSDPSLRLIPIVVLNGSKKSEDINRYYEIGASSYIPIPESFESLVDVIGILSKYWISVVKLPGYQWERALDIVQETGTIYPLQNQPVASE
jgi:CheY-like chemotaxis protein